MPVDQLHRTVNFDDFALVVTAWRFKCDRCGHAENFPDHPMPEGRSEFEHSKRWHISVRNEGEVYCLTCADKWK